MNKYHEVSLGLALQDFKKREKSLIEDFNKLSKDEFCEFFRNFFFLGNEYQFKTNFKAFKKNKNNYFDFELFSENMAKNIIYIFESSLKLSEQDKKDIIYSLFIDDNITAYLGEVYFPLQTYIKLLEKYKLSAKRLDKIVDIILCKCSEKLACVSNTFKINSKDLLGYLRHLGANRQEFYMDNCGYFVHEINEIVGT